MFARPRTGKVDTSVNSFRRIPRSVPLGLARAALFGRTGHAWAATVVWGGGDGTLATAANWVGGRTLGQTSESQPMGSPVTVTPTITSAAPLLWTNAGTSYPFFGTAGHLLELNISAQTLAADNSSPGSASAWGRIVIGTNTTNRVLAGDDGGTFWSIDPANFTGTNKQWSYTVSGDAIKSSPSYDYGTDTVMFGTEAGQVVALTSDGAAMTGYPHQPGASSDALRSAPLFHGGVLAVGSTTGKLFFLDRNNGSTGPALIRQYAFGSTESVSGVAVDRSSDRYMVTTSDPTAKDGRLYYFDFLSDPTPTSL